MTSEAGLLSRELFRRLEGSDPLAFAASLGFHPDAWQAKFIQSSAKRRIFNIARQLGKSTTAALSASHRALYRPKTLTLCISPSERQSKELLRKVRNFLHSCPSPVALTYDSTSEVELANGSRIVSLPASESTIRSFTANLIIEDEAGDVPDEVHYAVLPMIIASKGDLVLMGTPKGRRGHFFEAWERGGSDWERYEVKASDCPRIDFSELEKQKKALGAYYAQEYEGSFVNVAAGLVYGGFDEKQNLIEDPPHPYDTHGWHFMLGVDFGFHDACAFTVVGYLPNDRTVYVCQSFKRSGMTPSAAAAYVKTLPFKFNRIIGDEGGLGKGYAEEMRRQHHIPVEPAEKVNKAGYIDLLNGDMAEGLVKIVKRTNLELIEELTSLPWAEGRKKEADGYENHLADSLLYVWRASTAYLAKPVLTLVTPERKAAEDFARGRYEANKKHHDVRQDSADGVPSWYGLGDDS